MAANGGLHDMNDDIAEIDQNPLAAFFALGTDYSDHAELDAETEAWMREALTAQAELDAE